MLNPRLRILLIGALLLAAPAARAEDKPAAWYDKIKASGFIDAYYQANLNGLSGGINVPGSTSARAFDVRQNEFSLSGAKLALSTSDAASGVGAELDLLYGPIGTLSSGGLIEQAYVTYGLGPVAVKLGKFVTHVGYEVIDTPANFNYSRSVLFMQIPFDHVGAMLNYSTPLPGLAVMAGVADSNSLETANDEAKDILAQVSYAGVAGLSLYANYYLESNRAATTEAPFENTHYLNLLGTYQALPELALGAEYLYKTTIASTAKDDAGNALGTSVYDDASGLLQPFSPKGQGYALYASYATPIAGLTIAPRFEQYYAPDASSFANDYTLTLKYAQGPLTHYLELRADVEGPAGFNPSGRAAADPSELKAMQQTLTYAVTYSY